MAAHVSLRRLAEMVGVSAPFMYDVEHGRRTMSLETRAKVVSCLAIELPAEPDSRSVLEVRVARLEARVARLEAGRPLVLD
jgi:hypothetical protein